MNVGSELVAAWLSDLQNDYVGRPVTRVFGGPGWLSLEWRGADTLFFCWRPDSSGLCVLPPQKARSLLKSFSQPTSFAAALTKYLTGAKLACAVQPNGDRLLELKFSRFVGAGSQEFYFLAFELAGQPANAVLTDEDKKIIEAGRHEPPEQNQLRPIFPGFSYAPPPPLRTCPLSPELTDSQLLELLPSAQGMGPSLIRRLRDESARRGAQWLREALFGAPILQWAGSLLTRCGVLLPDAKPAAWNALQEASNAVFGEIERRALKDISKDASKILERAISRRRKHLDDLTNLLKASASRDRYRRAGEAIIQNLSALALKPAPEMTLPYWDEEGQQTVKVQLDLSRSPRANAERYFKKYRKLSVDSQAVTQQTETLQNELDDLTGLEENLRRVDDPSALKLLAAQITRQYGRQEKSPAKNRDAALPPHLRFNLDGTTILVGMNERGNRYVTFEAAKSDDLWFHVHERPGSHVILRQPPADQEAFDRACAAAASLALFYSSCCEPSWNVDRTARKHVHHIAGAGPAQVTYRDSTPLRADRLAWKEILSFES
ncbi:NFACT family protein [Jonquetella anthropi]|uniref:NFACT family protein n=1 Tax=Jonquetella anthropi TaxID=428712 RepID=UPI0001B910F0|nr:NFACT family protein [Jonquetella anthropi]EEX48442.1 hypothetical protein GCWU000246_00875 [Jonquetella anthropi E3_33 E1]